MLPEIIILPCIFIVAFLYSSVGHGGASGYLALMVLFGISQEMMRSTALLLNIFVSSIAFFHYYRKNYFKWKLFFPFAAASAPASFAGGMITLGLNVYNVLLAVALFIAITRMILPFNKSEERTKNVSLTAGIISGSVIGFISGLVGFGGGIFLSPLLIIFRWADMKQSAAVSSLFILVNSFAGFLGVLSTGLEFTSQLAIWTLIAMVGGFTGAYLGSSKLSSLSLKYILSAVLCFAGLKLILL